MIVVQVVICASNSRDREETSEIGARGAERETIDEENSEREAHINLGHFEQLILRETDANEAGLLKN